MLFSHKYQIFEFLVIGRGHMSSFLKIRGSTFKDWKEKTSILNQDVVLSFNNQQQQQQQQ